MGSIQVSFAPNESESKIRNNIKNKLWDRKRKVFSRKQDSVNSFAQTPIEYFIIFEKNEYPPLTFTDTESLNKCKGLPCL